MSAPESSAPRRTARMARARLDLPTVVAVLAPIVAILLAAVVATPDPGVTAPTPPTETALSRSTVVCPPGGSEVDIASASGASGTVAVRTGGIDRDADLSPGSAARLSIGRKPAVITGTGPMAPGLVASRFESPLASMDCRAPQFDQWFTGVGAGAKHRSTLQLVNPDAGRALVDITVLGRKGPVDVPALRGLAIRGGESRTFDLAEVVPRRDDLALHVQVLRGRVSASVQDDFRELGQGQEGRDSLAAQDRPSLTNLLLGLPGGAGQRTLVLANPGEDDGRATIRLVTADAVFTPRGVDDVDLPAGGVVRVPLAGVLKGTGASDDQRPYGLQVESTVPLTAGLVMFVEGDLAQGAPTPPLDDPVLAPLPDARNTLVLAGARSQGVVMLRLWDADGTELDPIRMEVASDRGYEVPLPRRARLLVLDPRRTPVSAVVLATGAGATLVRLREPVLTGLVPHVAPGAP